MTPAALLLALAALTAPVGDTLFVAIRIDDIQSRSTIAPRGLRPLEEVVEARGATLSYAVIPGRLNEVQNADGVLAAELRASVGHGHEIAQHGYTHICTRCGQSSHEMFCTTYDLPFTFEQQAAVVDAGAEILRAQVGVEPAIFVPPGHHADATTFEVLRDRGFSVLSTAGGRGDVVDGLFNIPPSEEYTWALSASNYASMRTDALAAMRAAADAYVLLLHDPFTRPGYENGLVLDWVGEVLDSLRAEHGDRLVFTNLSGLADRYRRIAATGIETVPVPTVASLAPWPSPARDVVRLEAPGEGRLELVDVAGRVVRRHAVPEGRAEMDVSDLPRGLYVMRWLGRDRMAWGTVVVQ